MARNPAQLCSELLLSDVLDFCSLRDLLICAMPVCRSWREQVVNHRTYWEYPTLVGGSRSPQSSESLFLLRLSRTRGRPMRVDVWPGDSHIVVTSLAEYLPHICSLCLYSTPLRAAAIFAAFRAYPAPLLKKLCLQFYDSPAPLNQDPALAISRMPRDLFSSHAAAVEHVNIFNIALPTGADFPTCLGNVTELLFQFTIRFRSSPETAPQRALPDVSVYLPKLEQLTVDAQVVLDAPALRQAHTWRHVRSVTLLAPTGGRAALLALRAVPRVMLRCQALTPAVEALELAATLHGPLDIAIPWESVSLGPARPFATSALQWRMAAQGARRVERWVAAHLPRCASDGVPLHRACALQQPPLADRIVQLSISFAEWDSLVGGGYFRVFPALEILVLALVLDPSNSFWQGQDAAAPSQLLCPRMNHLALTHTWGARFPRAVDFARVAAFVRRSLPGAQVPLMLELKELVDVQGSYTECPDVFSHVVHSPRDQTDSAKWE